MKLEAMNFEKSIFWKVICFFRSYNFCL